MVTVDQVELRHRLRVAPVVRGRMEGLVGAALGEDPRGGVAPHLEGEDARHVGLECERLHVPHLFDVLAEGIRHPGRGLGQLARLAAPVLRLGHLDAPLEFADVLHVAVEPRPVFEPQFRLEARGPRGHPVQYAPVLTPARHTLLRGAARSEELVEGHARVTDDGKRLGGGGPADRVGVHAGVAVRASAGLIHVLDAELHRRNGRVLTETLGVQLVHRRADVHVRALGLPRVRLREVDGAGAEVVATDLLGLERLRHLAVRVGHDGEVVAVGLERTQGAGAQIEVPADLRRRPEVLGRAPVVGARRAVHHLDADQTCLVDRRLHLLPAPARRDHCIQERQSHRHAGGSAQECPPRYVLARDEVHRPALQRESVAPNPV